MDASRQSTIESHGGTPEQLRVFCHGGSGSVLDSDHVLTGGRLAYCGS